MIDTILKKKTYEEFLESVKKDIYAEAGEVVTCCSGHYVMTCSLTTYVGNRILDGDFKDYAPSMYLAARRAGHCGICSSAYVTFTTRSNLDYGNVRFFIDGEFRERKYK